MPEISEYDELKRQSLLRKQSEEQKFANASRERLKKAAERKIKTAMIGALHAFEQTFGHLWGLNDKDSLTEEQMRFAELYESARQAILDNGNNQIRNFGVELSEYDVVWKRHNIVLPVK